MAKKSNIENQRKEIHADLLTKLKESGATGKQYEDLVNDYMRLWDTKNGLIADIEERGTKVLIETAAASNLKTNDSVPDLLKVNAQMLKILDCLGIKPTSDDGGSGGGGPGDEEM